MVVHSEGYTFLELLLSKYYKQVCNVDYYYYCYLDSKQKYSELLENELVEHNEINKGTSNNFKNIIIQNGVGIFGTICTF